MRRQPWQHLGSLQEWQRQHTVQQQRAWPEVAAFQQRAGNMSVKVSSAGGQQCTGILIACPPAQLVHRQQQKGSSVVYVRWYVSFDAVGRLTQ